MRTLIVVVLIYVGSIVGCATPNTNVSPPATSLVNQRISPGNEYELVLEGSDSTQTSYIGKVTEATSDSVTLESPLKLVRVTKSSSIPVVGKLFTNKGIGTEQLNGQVTLQRSDLSAIRQGSQPY